MIKTRWRLLVVLLLALPVASPVSAAPAVPQPVPRAHCGPGSSPETGMQGRVPAADYTSGRAARGYTCNARVIGHLGTTAGFKVLQYVDRAGHQCGYYDTTRIFPTDLIANAPQGNGVRVLDMRDPAHPKPVTSLTTPAMLSPHESLLLNAKRGLLVADMGNPGAYPGFVDVYDVSANCLAPVLRSSAPLGVLGHESAFAPDGRTFYVTSGGGSVMTAVDLTNPVLPSVLAVTYGKQWHGARVSDDGKYLFTADMGLAGLSVYDVSSIQARTANPGFRLVSQLTWPSASIPQVPIPMTIRGRHYLLEVDEFAGYETDVLLQPGYHPEHPVGAARILDVENPLRPRLVSNIRLEVNQPSARSGPSRNDPGVGSTELGGYAGHYCSVPREVDPGIVACSFLASGERVFDVRDPRHPREVAYVNMPSSGGAAAYSQAAWDLKRHQLWYGDAASGLWVVQLTNGVWPATLS
jgi:hypothetical protein